MASHTVLQFSPSESGPGSPYSHPRRQIRPSPEKLSPTWTTVIVQQKRAASATATGSSTKKGKGNEEESVLSTNAFSSDFPDGPNGFTFEARLDVKLDQDEPALQRALATSRRVVMSYSLIENGRAGAPPLGDFSELERLFPTTFFVEILSPFLVVRLQTLPPKPWPFKVGGLPLQFTTKKRSDCLSRGKGGRGPKALEHFNLQRKDDFSDEILTQAVALFQDSKVKIRDIAWLAGFWQITLTDDTDLKKVPGFIAGHGAYYKLASEHPEPDPSALKAKVPQGVDYDNSSYVTSPDALLRPGIMLGSSIRTVTKVGENENQYKKTSSGILVVDGNGDLYITVSSHGFEDDGLVYHPDPHTGMVIGNIVRSIPHTDISLAKLNPGLRYINETFGSDSNPNGVQATEISTGYPPNLRAFDDLSMNNPFSGDCDGQLIAFAARIPDLGGVSHVRYNWFIFETGSVPAYGSCGSPIFDANGKVVGLFRLKMMDEPFCYAVSACELEDAGYKICQGEQTFP